MRKVLEILTPENVYVEYELAGLGSRFAAVIIDILIQIFVSSLVLLGLYYAGFDYSAVALDLGPAYTLVFLTTLLILFHLLYFPVFEIIMKGQSPGKKVFKIRVIRQNGEPVGVIESFLRNLFRIADIIPIIYVADAFFVIFTENYKRIGDFAGNTIVVKVRNVDKLVTIDEILNQNNYTDEYVDNTNIYPVTHFEYEVLKEFLARKDKVGEKRPIFAFNLNRYFSRKFNLENNPYNSPYKFFEEIIRMNSGVN